MMNYAPRLAAAVTLAGLLLASQGTARAAFTTGTQGMSDDGSPAIMGGSTLSTATGFVFGIIHTTTAETGSFAATSSSGLNFGSAMLDMSNPTGFTFGNAQFGMFAATSAMTTAASDQSRAFTIMGMFTSGTNFGDTTTNVASLNVSFTANSSSSGTSYSDSGTLSVPAAATVPEPASVALLGLGLLGAGCAARRRAR